MSTPTYNIDLEDERFQQVEADKQNALTDVKNTYDGMIEQAGGFYDEQIQASKDWANQQQEIQQAQTDFTIQQIEQQKEQAQKDYMKQQSGAYVDYQKQTGQYGANAEQMAAAGLSNTGYSESSKVAMYNTYQNINAAAREAVNKATMNYNNMITEAKLQNDATKAEIAFQAYQQQIQFALQAFQYENSLITELMAQQQAVDDKYYSRWQDVYNQMYQENAFNESIRQYEEQTEYQEEQDRLAQENWQKEYELAQAELEAQTASFEADNTVESAPLGVPFADQQPSSGDDTKIGYTSVEDRFGKPGKSDYASVNSKAKELFSSNQQECLEYLADAVMKGQISETEAQQIIKNLNESKSSGKSGGVLGGGGSKNFREVAKF